jgi:hypothetical protein
MKQLITLATFFQIACTCAAQDSSILLRDVNNKFTLVGELGKKLGTLVTIKGVVTDEFSKRNRSGPNITIQMINDSATQHFIQIPLSSRQYNEPPIAGVKYGATYKLEVFETGEFVGTPSDVLKRYVIPPQTTGFYFQNRLITVFSQEKIDPIEWSPAQFIGRNALLLGIAKNENGTPVIQSPTWKLILPGYKKWTDEEIGKTAEVYGKIGQTGTKDTYTVETGWARLVKLEDQLGKTVKLRGKAWSMNGHWWFEYMGMDIYIEKMNELPGWTADNHGRPMEITGTLEQAELPRIDQITLKSKRDIKMYYIVKNASWVRIDELLAPELGK